MKLLPDKYPSNIPYIFASFISAIFISYTFTGVLSEMFFGRPSSTSSIAFFTIPIITAFLFLASFVIGLILRFIIGRNEPERIMPTKTMRSIYIALGLAILVSVLAGGISFIKYERSQRPHVILGNAALEKSSNVKYKDANQIDAKLLLTIFDDEKNKLSPLTWNNKPIRFKLQKDSNNLTLHDEKGQQLAFIDLSSFDYITRVYAVPFAVDNASQRGLAVLVHLRSTSRRSVLLLYNADASLLYEEFLERECIDNVMKAVKDDSNNEYVWLNAETPVLYRFKKG